MYTKTNSSNIPPLLPPAQMTLQQQSSKPQIPSLLDTNFQKQRRFEITRYDRQDTKSIVDTLINSLRQPSKPQNKNIEVLTIDYKHGLYPATSTTKYLVENKEDEDLSDARSRDSDKQEQKQPPSLLSLKLDLPNKFDSRVNLRFDSSGNLLPINEPFLKEEPNEPAENPIIPIEDILCQPGRYKRPPKLVIILRGLPGSGKSYLTKLIKAEEEKYASESEKPKTLSIDNYFSFVDEQFNGKKKQTVVMYEYDASLNETYQRSLIKSFKKILDDQLFNFVIVDMINERVDQIDEMANYAKSRGFCPFIIEMDSSLTQLFASRNIHDRTLEEIQALKAIWEPLPSSYTKLDASYFIEIPFHSPLIKSSEVEKSCRPVDKESPTSVFKRLKP